MALHSPTVAGPHLPEAGTTEDVEVPAVTGYSTGTYRGGSMGDGEVRGEG